MIPYLKAGWHTRPGRLQLRSDVTDGAIDTASMLFRAAVPAEALTRVALKVRGLTTLLHPVMRLATTSGKFSTRERTILEQRVQGYIHSYPARQAFLHGCFKHKYTVEELRALCLHVIHVSQMMQLLRLAKVSNRRQRTKKVTTRKTAPSKASPTKTGKACQPPQQKGWYQGNDAAPRALKS